LVLSEVWKADIDTAKDFQFAPWELLSRPTIHDWADWYLVLWHNGVHQGLGGTMDGGHMEVAPAAVSFWLFHAYLNNIYSQWQNEHF
jgi:hypothetical protein